MKKILVTAVLSMLVLMGWSQQTEKKHYILPGNGKIDVEMLNKKIDLNMDISNLIINELRVLRNSFYAKQGYAFTMSDLRSVFDQTTWYGVRRRRRSWLRHS